MPYYEQECQVFCPICGHPQGNYPLLSTAGFGLMIFCCDSCNADLVFLHCPEPTEILSISLLDPRLPENPRLPGWVRDVMTMIVSNAASVQRQSDLLAKLENTIIFRCSSCNFSFSSLPDVRPLFFCLIAYQCPLCKDRQLVCHYGPREQWHAFHAVDADSFASHRASVDLPEWLSRLIVHASRNTPWIKGKLSGLQRIGLGPITEQEAADFRGALDSGWLPPL